MNSFDEYNKKVEGFYEKAKTEVAQQQKERAQKERERRQWESDHRHSNVPRHWKLLTDNGIVQSYSDGGRIRYVKDGVEVTSAEEYDELNRRYGY